MRFSFSADQEEFRGTLRRALEARSPTKEVRRLMATDEGFEREGWKRLNQELGLTGVHIPEAYGGQGFGFGELGIVLAGMGRNLLWAPRSSRRRWPPPRSSTPAPKIKRRPCCRVSPTARSRRPSPSRRKTAAW